MRWIPQWVLISALVLTLAACASTERSTTTGQSHAVTFSTEKSPKSVSIECGPPSPNVTAGWVDECNELARRFLGQLVATGRLSTLPEPPFGEAGRAVKSAWRQVREMDGAIDIESLRLRREIDLTPAVEPTI